MRPDVEIEVVSPKLLAAVTREVAVGRVPEVWRPALDQVWAFLRSQPGLRTDGHNIFVYHHPTNAGASGDSRVGEGKRRALAHTSWEIYGDWNDDPTKLETLVLYLLR